MPDLHTWDFTFQLGNPNGGITLHARLIAGNKEGARAKALGVLTDCSDPETHAIPIWEGQNGDEIMLVPHGSWHEALDLISAVQLT